MNHANGAKGIPANTLTSFGTTSLRGTLGQDQRQGFVRSVGEMCRDMSREYVEYIYELLDVAERKDFFNLTSGKFDDFSSWIERSLELQMPRKVDTEITEIRGAQHICPSCRGAVGYMYDYCQDCGQALDWGEKKDGESNEV